MESLSIGHLIPSVQANFPTRRLYAYITSEDFAGDTLFPRRVKKQNINSHIISRSRRSVYQDFQEFVKPSHILPATEVTTYPMHVSEEIVSSLELDQLASFYVVELCTSRDFGSCLRDLNAAILLCLIDENGGSILQRISAVSLLRPRKDKDEMISEYIHFQRGSVDVVTFKGPKLENIAALWIGLESGSWRMDAIGLKVMNSPTTSSSTEGRESYFSGKQYKFEAKSLALGDGGLPVAELRPILATQIAGEDISAMSSINPSAVTLDSDSELSKEGTMKEYADLKLSLLLYDSILVVAGATISAALSSNEADANYFLAGGIGGFLHLLMLQRSVDGLSAPLSSAEEDRVENSLPSYGGLKASVMSLVFVMAAAAAVVASKHWMGGSNMAVSPSELFAGVAGFLTCKGAVVLAAFKPIQMSAKENKNE